MRSYTIIVLIFSLLFSLPVAAQDEDETSPSCDYASISDAIAEAQALISMGSLGEAQSLLGDARDQLDLCEKVAQLDDTEVTTDDDPAAPLAILLESSFTGDVEGIGPAVCAALREDAIAFAQEAATDFESFDPLEVDLSKIEYIVSDNTGETANITLEGSLTIMIDDQPVKIDAAGLIGDTPIPVIKEDGAWVICDQGFIEGDF